MKPTFVVGMIIALFLASAPAWAAAPVVTGQPQSAFVTTGLQATFGVSYSSSCGAVNVQWQFDGVNISNGPVYSGVTTGALSVNATAPQAGSYRAVLTCANGGGVANTLAATLAVLATGTVSTVPPIIHNLGWSGCSGANCTIWWNGVNLGALTLTPRGGTPVNVTGLGQLTVSPAAATIYTLTASNSAGTQARSVLVPAGGYAATINSCRTISTPGRYQVISSISTNSTSTPCLDVKNTNDVYIDCVAGVTVSGVGGGPLTSGSPATSGAINFTNVNGFAVRSCNVLPTSVSSGAYFVSFANSSMGYVVNSTFGNSALTAKQLLQTYQSSYITLDGDTIYDGIDVHDTSTGIFIAGANIKNTNTVVGAYTAATVFEWGGGISGTTVIDSTLDGGATSPGVGADDGIVGDKVINDLYAYNLLKNFWDSGVEIAAQSYSDTIYQNTLQNAGLESIGLTFQGALRDSIVSWNQINMSSNFASAGDGHVYPFYIRSIAPSGTVLYFQNNSLDHNFVTNGQYSAPAQFLTGNSGGSWVVGNNIVSNNNFNYNNYAGIAAPVFTTPYVPGIVTDGGGNICAHPNPSGYPLVCH